MTTTPRRWKSTAVWISAWVPMTMSTAPAARSARSCLRALPVTLLVSSSTRRGRSPKRLSGSGTARSASELADGHQVLLGENLGGRHQGALVARLHGGQQRGHGDDGLARPDVALEQAVHRARRRQVGVDLADDPPLRIRQLVRQGVVEAPYELSPDLVDEADRVGLDLALAADEHELHAQQLVEGEAPAGIVLGVDRLGEVDRAQRRAALDEFQSGADVVGQRVGDAADLAPIEGVLDPAGELPRRQLHLFALRVDRHDPTRCGRRSDRRSDSSSAGRCGTGRRFRTGRR